MGVCGRDTDRQTERQREINRQTGSDGDSNEEKTETALLFIMLEKDCMCMAKITCDVYVVSLAKLDEVLVVKVRMRFDLVDDGFHDALFQEAFKLRRVEVGDADGFNDAAFV